MIKKIYFSNFKNVKSQIIYVYIYIFIFCLFSCNTKNNGILKSELKIKAVEPIENLKNICLSKFYISYKNIDYYTIKIKKKNIYILLINSNNQGYFPIFFKDKGIPKNFLIYSEEPVLKAYNNFKCIDPENPKEVKILKNVKIEGTGVGEKFLHLDLSLHSLDNTNFEKTL